MPWAIQEIKKKKNNLEDCGACTSRISLLTTTSEDNFLCEKAVMDQNLPVDKLAWSTFILIRLLSKQFMSMKTMPQRLPDASCNDNIAHTKKTTPVHFGVFKREIHRFGSAWALSVEEAHMWTQAAWYSGALCQDREDILTDGYFLSTFMLHKLRRV